MRQFTKTVLSGLDGASKNGEPLDSNQWINASFQIVFADTHAAGTFKLQASNQVAQVGPTPFPTILTWTDIPSATAAISAGSSAILSLSNMAYRWIRAVYTNTANYFRVSTVTTIADVSGSLKSTYFLLTSINGGVAKDFYVWYDNGSGVDPAVPARTGIKVTYTDDDSANAIATATRLALNALTSDFVATGATNAVIITNVEPGVAAAASDGAAATGFAFANTNPGVAPTTMSVNAQVVGI